MDSAFQHAKFRTEWLNAIDEAVLYANLNSNRLFQIQKQANRFEREGNTIFEGLKVRTAIHGKVVDFWIGIEVTSRQTNDMGEIALYFDADANDPEMLKTLEKKATGFKESSPTKVVPGVWLFLKDVDVKSHDKQAAIRRFFTEAVDSLR